MNCAAEKDVGRPCARAARMQQDLLLALFEGVDNGLEFTQLSARPATSGVCTRTIRKSREAQLGAQRQTSPAMLFSESMRYYLVTGAVSRNNKIASFMMGLT
jgi:hypothetical protein